VIYSNQYNEKRIVVFSGSSISIPSNIQAFNGLWNEHKIEDICNENTWKSNKTEVPNFYNERRGELEKAEPNAGHYFIKELQDHYGIENVLNITQNIDNLLEKTNVETLHVQGELTKMECESCDTVWSIGYKPFDIETDRCPKCNSSKAVKPCVICQGKDRLW